VKRLAFLLLLAPVLALADGPKSMARTDLPAYRQECASCHTAYPPGLLPASSWQRIMGNLQHHYGTDASLDDATVKQIGTWLQANAGTYRRVTEAPPDDRITRSAWFERKHRRVTDAVWRHASIRSAANCAACHPGAEKGDFDDDSLRLPAGLDPKLRRGLMHD